MKGLYIFFFIILSWYFTPFVWNNVEVFYLTLYCHWLFLVNPSYGFISILSTNNHNLYSLYLYSLYNIEFQTSFSIYRRPINGRSRKTSPNVPWYIPINSRPKKSKKKFRNFCLQLFYYKRRSIGKKADVRN